MKTSVTAPLPRAIASSRSANRSVMPSRARGASPSAWTARRLSGSDARTAPMTRNVAASPSIAYRMPAPPATRPPTAGPATNPIPRIDSTRPFARAISRSPASSGISANSAAPETATPTPSSTARGSISASEPAKASRQATTAWKTADQIASERVSRRSTSTPTCPERIARGDQRQIRSAATPPPDHSWFARRPRAIIATQSPIAETAIAPATTRRSRRRVMESTLRIGAGDLYTNVCSPCTLAGHARRRARRPRRPGAQPQGHHGQASAERPDLHHRPLGVREVQPGVRHDLRRGAAALRRVAVGLRAPVPADDGEAGRRLDRRHQPGGLDRPEDDLAEPAVDGRDRHRDLRLPAPAVRPRGAAALPGLRAADRRPVDRLDRRADPRPARRDAVHRERTRRPGSQGRVPRPVRGAAQRGLLTHQGGRRPAHARRAAGTRQEVQAHDRGGRRSAADEGGPADAADAVGRDGGGTRRGSRLRRPRRRG